MRIGVLGAAIFLVLLAQIVRAEEVTCTNSYAGTQTRTYTLPPGTLNPGRNQLDAIVRGDDVEGARADLMKTFYTSELTTFSDTTCARGPCNHSIPGTAHRSWPIGACVAICNLHTRGLCAIAVVMDRGPNTALGCRTIDGNLALKARLNLTGMTQATYQLVSLTGPCDTGGPIGIPTPDPVGSVTRNLLGPSAAAPVGSPTQIGQPAQAAYRQQADFSNYQSSSPTQPSPYFSQNPLTQGGLTGMPLSPIYQSSSTAETLLNLITNTNPSGRASTSPFRVTVTPGREKGIVSSSSRDVVIVTPLPSARPQQTFVQAAPARNVVLTQGPLTDVLSSIIRQLQSIFARMREIIGTRAN